MDKVHAFGSGGQVVPTWLINKTLQYNLTLDNVTPLSLSRLQMMDQFSITNSTRSYESIGFSSMDYAAMRHIVHGLGNQVSHPLGILSIDNALAGEKLGQHDK